MDMTRKTVASLLLFFSFLPLAPLLASDFEATLQWAERSELATLHSGVVEEVVVVEGERVAAGGLLVQLDSRLQRSRLAEAEAVRESRRLMAEEAARELDRAQELFDRGSLSENALQLAQIDAARAKADEQRAAADLVAARRALQHTALRAPGEIVVVRRLAEVGQTVVGGLVATPLVVVASGERMLARALVAEAELAGLRPGGEVEIRVGATGYRAAISRVAMEPTLVDGRRLFAVDAVFAVDPIAANLRAGLAATLRAR